MKNILVVYFSQTGQLKAVVDSVMGKLAQSNEVNIHYEELRPVKEYPFPWRDQFFDVFPDSVTETGCELQPFSFDLNAHYDLVVLGCQTWFLSPSVPVTAFLKHPQIIKFLAKKNIVTIHGARNMCFSAQESIKKYISNAKAKLVGNIVLGDNNTNYISAITIIKWLVYGNKGPYGFLPDAGISKKTIQEASVFGEDLMNFIKSPDSYLLQNELVNKGAVNIRFSVLATELNAKKIFKKFNRYVSKAPKGSKLWHKRIKVFRAYLLFALFGLSPIAMLVFSLVHLLFRFRTKNIIKYYQGIQRN
ncbi:hypothetical protein [Plebeiibacterium marinum]|uniref:Dialkylrecorsinol condensing enzyme DarA n=1 Tax=Plebeiibacterium marinum TaxID=2992111 RepID=A0AAE3MDL3_9BACT|nr:hypothetical protein [Plebeiobacterium marinum]MCW3805789.1 hypothetical protein [Plebeiobacterium marinum]